MGNEIQLVRDGDDLAVIGEPSAVERFLREYGLWDGSRAMDLGRIRPLLDVGAGLAKAASEISANSGRWMKLTGDSARIARQFPLLKNPETGNSYATARAKDGSSFVKNLQFESGPGSLLSNPAALSSVAAVMAQAAARQAGADVASYLARIDEKIDDVLAKVDGTVLKDMKGARAQINRALTMREHEHRVSDEAWGEVQNAFGKLADVQGYALGELRRIAEKLEAKTRVGKLAETAEVTAPEVQKWLSVLAECFQLQNSFDAIVLERAMNESPEALNARRRGLEANREERRDVIANETRKLLERMDVAVGRANAKLFWNRVSSPVVVESGNLLASRVHAFHGAVGIQGDPRSWDLKQLGRVAEVGAQVIQKSKEAAPVVVAGATLAGAAVVGKKLHDQGQA